MMPMRWIVLGALLLHGCIIDRLTREQEVATEACDSLSATYCRKAVGCGAYPSQASCLAKMAGEWPCGDALAVEPSFQACANDLQAATCDRVSGWPGNDCRSILKFLP